jgi:hypothetical protein
MKPLKFFSLAVLAGIMFISCENTNPSRILDDVWQFEYCGKPVNCYQSYKDDNGKLLYVSVVQKEISLYDNLAIKINNQTDKEFVYGTPFRLYYFENNQWNYVEFAENIAFTAIGYISKSNSVGNEGANLQLCFGNLKAGKYRYVKEFSPNQVGGSDINIFLYDEFILK